MIYVIYRILYGTDFLEKSIKSLYDIADKIFIGYSEEPWTKPKNFPNIKDIEISPLEIIKTNFSNSNKIDIFFHHVSTPKGQFNYLFNRTIKKLKENDIVVFMEPDMIWEPLLFENFIKEIDTHLFTSQIELWKTYNWRIPQRARIGPAAYKGIVPELGFGQTPINKYKNIRFSQYCHNFGFCLNEKTMLYKHLAALDFSSKIGDSVPNKNWYTDKWLNWVPETINLEISKGREHLIPKAIPYEMPKSLLKLMENN